MTELDDVIIKQDGDTITYEYPPMTNAELLEKVKKLREKQNDS